MDFQKFRSGGELSDVQVVVEGQTFKLHRFPLYTRSDYFLKEFAKHGMEQVIVLDSFPGGTEIFTLVADFCYNIHVDVTPSNVIGLRCAAKYLEMHGTGNLDEKTGLFIENHVVNVKRGKDINSLLIILSTVSQFGENETTEYIFEQCIVALTYHWNRCQYGVSGVNEVTLSNTETIFFNMEFNFFMRVIQALKKRLDKTDILNALISEYILYVITNKYHQTPELMTNGKNDEAINGTSDQGKCIKMEFNEETLKKIKTLLDAIKPSIAVSKHTAAIWLKPLLAAYANVDNSHEILGSIAASMANQMDQECISMMTEETLQHFAENVSKDNLSDSTKSLLVEHLLKQAQQEKLSSSAFIKLCQMLPLSDISCHDNFLFIINGLRKSGDLTDAQLNECLQFVILKKCTVKALREVHKINSDSNGGLPPKLIADAALDLCDTLQDRLNATSRIIQEQEKEISSLSIQTFGAARSGSPLMNTRSHVGGYSQLPTIDVSTGRSSNSPTANLSRVLDSMWSEHLDSTSLYHDRLSKKSEPLRKQRQTRLK